MHNVLILNNDVAMANWKCEEPSTTQASSHLCGHHIHRETQILVELLYATAYVPAIARLKLVSILGLLSDRV